MEQVLDCHLLARSIPELLVAVKIIAPAATLVGLDTRIWNNFKDD